MTTRCGLFLSLSVALAGLLSGCTNVAPAINASRLSPMQVRAIETRTYDGHDVKAALQTVLNVLQDEGFIVDYGNSELGLLHASKTSSGTFDGNFTPAIGVVNGNQQWGFVTLEATANVSNFGSQTRVRINFQKKTSDWYGRTMTATPLSDPRAYQEFFAKLDRGLFIQKQGL